MDKWMSLTSPEKKWVKVYRNDYRREHALLFQ